MSKFILGNTIRFGSQTLEAGKIIDSDHYDLSALQSAGAALIPENPVANEAAKTLSKAKLDGQLATQALAYTVPVALGNAFDFDSQPADGQIPIWNSALGKFTWEDLPPPPSDPDPHIEGKFGLTVPGWVKEVADLYENNLTGGIKNVSMNLQTAINECADYAYTLLVLTGSAYDPFVIPASKRVMIITAPGIRPVIMGNNAILFEDGVTECIIQGIVIHQGASVNDTYQGSAVGYTTTGSAIRRVAFIDMDFNYTDGHTSSVILESHWEPTPDYTLPPQSNEVAFINCRSYQGGDNKAAFDIRGVKNLYIGDCVFDANYGTGMGINLRSCTGKIVNCLARNINGANRYGFSIETFPGGELALVDIKNCIVENATEGFRVVGRAKASIVDCLAKNCQTGFDANDYTMIDSCTTIGCDIGFISNVSTPAPVSRIYNSNAVETRVPYSIPISVPQWNNVVQAMHRLPLWAMNGLLPLATDRDVVLLVNPSAKNANDDNKRSTPFRTIQGALNTVAVPHHPVDSMKQYIILIAPGIYDEDLSVEAETRVQLIGLGQVVLGNGNGTNYESTNQRSITVRIASQYGIGTTKAMLAINNLSEGIAEHPFGTHTGFVISGNITYQVIGNQDNDIYLSLKNTSVRNSIRAPTTADIYCMFKDSNIESLEMSSAVLTSIENCVFNGLVEAKSISRCLNSVFKGNLRLKYGVSGSADPRGFYQSVLLGDIETGNGGFEFDGVTNYHWKQHGGSLVNGTITITEDLTP